MNRLNVSSYIGSKYFEILTPSEGMGVPLIVHVPHSSVVIPENFRLQFALTEFELDAEILAMTDRYTDELFHATIELGGMMFINRTSRLVMDPERFPDSQSEPMNAKGMGAVYTKTSDGKNLRVDDFGPEDHKNVMENLYWPYSRALENVVADCFKHFSKCLIIDAHSFPSKPLPYEDASLERPDICLGYEKYHAPHNITETSKVISKEFSWHVADNLPFAGSYVPLKYYQSEPRIESLMIEINRSKYMYEGDGRKSDQYFNTINLVTRLLKNIVDSQ